MMKSRFRHMLPALLVAVPATALAPSVYGAEPRDAVFSPSRVYYEADVTIDVEQAVLTAAWRLEFELEERSSGHVAFLLNRGLTIHRIEGKGVTGFEITQFDVPHWNLITIELGHLPLPERVIALHLDYSGQLELPTPANQISSEWIELNIESMWHPLLASTDREMVGVLRVQLPSAWEVVGVGPSALHDRVHVILNNTPQIDIAIVASPYFSRTRTENFTAFHHGVDSTRVKAVLEAAELCAAYLNPLYGRERPLPHGHLILTNRGGPSYARATFIVFSHIEDPTDRVSLEPGICHELAHHWTAFGNFLGPDHWISEAFPEVVSAQYLRRRFGQEEFENRINDWRIRGATAGPVWTADTTGRPSGPTMYVLAPYLLFRLESRIGQEQFARFVELYMVQDVRYTEELLRLLSEVAGADASEMFEKELSSSGAGVLDRR